MDHAQSLAIVVVLILMLRELVKVPSLVAGHTIILVVAAALG
jgi:hypothetical protein